MKLSKTILAFCMSAVFCGASAQTQAPSQASTTATAPAKKESSLWSLFFGQPKDQNGSDNANQPAAKKDEKAASPVSHTAGNTAITAPGASPNAGPNGTGGNPVAGTSIPVQPTGNTTEGPKVPTVDMAYWVSYINQTPTMDLVYKSILNLDCTTGEEQCSYIAKVEALSYIRACKEVVPVRLRASPYATVDMEDAIDEAIRIWGVRQTDFYKDQLLDDQTPLAQSIKKNLVQYIKNATLEDMSLNCSRLAMIQNNDDLLPFSDLLQNTRHFEQWSKAYKERKGQ